MFFIVIFHLCQEGVADLKQIKELNEEKRRSARRKEFIMAELLETERSYVKVSITNNFFQRTYNT
jgi:hypothetical protein